MKLNKYTYKALALGAVSLFAVSCSDLLDLENPNSLTTATAFSTEDDINSSLTGVYHSFWSNHYACSSFMLFSGQSDEVVSYSGNVDNQQFCNMVYSNVNINWNWLAWNRLYEQISRCNQVITYAENITEWATYDKEQIVAQARAIRAYAYYQLAMLYQIPPYVDYVAEAGDQPEASEFGELCQRIIDDADYAYKTLPASYSNGEYRVTKWFAACVAGKTYMNWGDYLTGGYHYAEALPYFEDVVKNGGFQLVDNQFDNFSINAENNSESIFEIQNAASSAYGWQNYYETTNNSTVPSQSMWRWKFLAPGPLGWGDFNAELWVLTAFKNEKTVDGKWDERITSSVLYPDIFTDFPDHVQWQAWDATTGYNAEQWNEQRIWINKYTAQNESWETVNSDNSEGTNNRIFRLGEIKLDYAECLAQTGDLPGAVEQLNDVRNRAGLCDLGERQNYKENAVFTEATSGEVTDFNAEYGYAAFENNGAGTLEDFMKVLEIEDMKETAFECERLVDLRRWGISRDDDFLNRVKKRSNKYSLYFNKVRAWIPMPIDDVNNNPNLEQLTGW